MTRNENNNKKKRRLKIKRKEKKQINNQIINKTHKIKLKSL